jgi:hypothetical protein
MSFSHVNVTTRASTWSAASLGDTRTGVTAGDLLLVGVSARMNSAAPVRNQR